MLFNIASLFAAARLVAGAPPVVSSVKCEGTNCKSEPACSPSAFDPITCALALSTGDSLSAVYNYRVETAPICSSEVEENTHAYALELPAGAFSVIANWAQAKSSGPPLPTGISIDAGVDCDAPATHYATSNSGGTATFEDLDLDVLALPGLVISGQSVFDTVTIVVRYAAIFAVAGETPPTTTPAPPTTTTTPTPPFENLTIIAVACATECPVECTTRPIDLDVCLAYIPANELVTLTYVLETSIPSCATTPHVGIVIPVTGDIYSAEFVAAEGIPSGATTSAGVSADYACSTAASGAVHSVGISDNTAIFNFTEALIVMENQVLAMTVDAADAPAVFAYAKVTIQGQLQGTMGVPPAAAAKSLLALGTFSTAAYLATLF